MTGDQSSLILQQFATLAENVAGLRRDGDRRDETAEQERLDSYASRRELYEKVNGVAEDLATVKGDVKVTAMVAAQARDTSAETKTAFEKASPTIADMEQAKKIGAALLWLLGGGAVAIVTAVAGWGDAIKAGLSHWLGIK